MAAMAWNLLSVAASAAPYVPADDAEVLESLPRSLLAGQGELAQLRGQLDAGPDDPEVAAAVAQRYLQIGTDAGDPRYFGYARAALSRWWEQPAAPTGILRLRAKLREKDHLYDAAIADLRALLVQQPADAQAWVELSNIYRVQGKYEHAEKAIERLSRVATAGAVAYARIPLLAVTGRVAQADRLLTAIAQVTADDAAPNTWLAAMQADVARMRGDDRRAERRYRQGLQASPDNLYLLRAYGDFLLDRGRDREALELLIDHGNDNGALLGATIALTRLGAQQQAAKWTAVLASRFEEIRMRGSQPHGRYEARFHLQVLDDPERALEVALANWQQQRELRDSQVVLQAALAAKQAAAARPVVEFLQRHGTDDADLNSLLEHLKPLIEQSGAPQ
ncbi:MAG: hypothetical protein CMJ58_08755 [Planctomycetaceae bacterium]|nr:hypothetical protein [Planctomycetaceae bacterium]